MLFQLGPVQFDVLPLSLTGYEREVGADFAAKDVIGGRRPRENTGIADEPISLEAVLFPHRFGGADQLDLLQRLAEQGEPQMLIRGDGRVFGWYVIEKVKEKAEYLNASGVGRKTGVTISLQAVPDAASSGSILSLLTTLLS